MKPKINEITVKFLQCPKCNFEKSRLLAESEPNRQFSWKCPQCNTNLFGEFRLDGDINVKLGSERSKNMEYILIEKAKDFSPWIMLAQYHGVESAENLKQGRSFTLTMCRAERDEINNPLGLPQFRAIYMK